MLSAGRSRVLGRRGAAIAIRIEPSRCSMARTVPVVSISPVNISTQLDHFRPGIMQTGFQGKVLATLYHRVFFDLRQSVNRGEHRDRCLTKKSGRVKERELVHQSLIE